MVLIYFVLLHYKPKAMEGTNKRGNKSEYLKQSPELKTNDEQVIYSTTKPRKPIKRKYIVQHYPNPLFCPALN
jgi:hypothetical protein